MVREKIFGLVKSDGHFQNTYGFCENSVALYPTVNPDDPNINIRKLVGGFNLPLWKIWRIVSWDDFPFTMEKNSSKPPARK